MGDQTPAAGRYTFSTNAELGGAGLRLYGVHGTHTLGGLYEHTARVATTQPEGLDDDALDALLSGYARFGPARTTEGQTWGVVRHVAMLPMLPRASDAWVTAYELELVPKLWRLTLTRRSHAYAAGTHLEIVKAILAEHGLTEGNFVEDRCEETYAPREMTVQYDETDYDFALRLCQHNGIHLHFVQGEGTEKLVLGDRNGAFDALPEHDALEHSTLEVPPTDEAPVVWGLRRHRRPRPRSVVVRDYNWRTPQQPVRALHAADERSGLGWVDLYGEHVADETEARRLARVRAEELMVEHDVIEAKTVLRSVQPGTWFELTAHPNPELNRRYLVIHTDERLADGGHSYLNAFRAIPFETPFRPARTVPWPRVEGLTNAIVDGESRSTATPLDAQGRYRVVLPYDDGAQPGGRASRWVRRAQPSAGEGYGTHFPLHIGAEVALAHVNGDPDRPIIVGAVPNAATPTPVSATNATHSRIRSASGVTIEMDDDC